MQTLHPRLISKIIMYAGELTLTKAFQGAYYVCNDSLFLEKFADTWISFDLVLRPKTATEWLAQLAMRTPFNSKLLHALLPRVSAGIWCAAVRTNNFEWIKLAMQDEKWREFLAKNTGLYSPTLFGVVFWFRHAFLLEFIPKVDEIVLYECCAMAFKMGNLEAVGAIVRFLGLEQNAPVQPWFVADCYAHSLIHQTDSTAIKPYLDDFCTLFFDFFHQANTSNLAKLVNLCNSMPQYNAVLMANVIKVAILNGSKALLESIQSLVVYPRYFCFALKKNPAFCKVIVGFLNKPCGLKSVELVLLQMLNLSHLCVQQFEVEPGNHLMAKGEELRIAVANKLLNLCREEDEAFQPSQECMWAAQRLARTDIIDSWIGNGATLQWMENKQDTFRFYGRADIQEYFEAKPIVLRSCIISSYAGKSIESIRKELPESSMRWEQNEQEQEQIVNLKPRNRQYSTPFVYQAVDNWMEPEQAMSLFGRSISMQEDSILKALAGIYTL
jgi:hypothetical protein